MKRIILIVALVIGVLSVNAQEKNSSHSKWKETKNGVTYEMEVKVDGLANKAATKPHLKFTIKGDTSNLTKLGLTSSKEFFVTVPVSKEAQDINVEPGHYTFKFYHQKLGEQQFEVDLKTGDDKVVVLTLGK